MNVTFDTASSTEAEVRGLIALLSALLPPSGPSASSQASVPVSGSQFISSTSTIALAKDQPVSRQDEEAPVNAATELPAESAPAKRGRKPRAVADAAAASAEPAAGAAEAPQAGVAQPGSAPVGQVIAVSNGQPNKVVSADDLRALLNGFIARHSMEEAIGKLRAFGCNRVSEALTLEPSKLSELAADLNG